MLVLSYHYITASAAVKTCSPVSVLVTMVNETRPLPTMTKYACFIYPSLAATLVRLPWWILISALTATRPRRS